MKAEKNWKVVIFQHRLLHYRVDFFNRLRDACMGHGIDLAVVHGQASPLDKFREDETYLDWATPVKNVWWNFGGKEILWQPTPEIHRDADLFVLLQENRLLSAYVFLLKRAFGLANVAYWGHGANFQSVARNGLRERWKRALINKVDWWFAYTEPTRSLLLDAGFDPKRISVLNNAIDTERFSRELASVSSEELTDYREKSGISWGARVAVFCGSLYLEKRLPEMIDAADLIANKDSDFRLLVAGAGPATDIVVRATRTRPWMTYVGPKFGREKALLFRAADVVLNPGLVGLHVLDAFCAGVPMITMRDSPHSPEIAYLEHGRNGWISDGGIEAYARDASRILRDSSLRDRLAQGAREAARKYTLEAMVDSFLDGILKSRAILRTHG